MNAAADGGVVKDTDMDADDLFGFNIKPKPKAMPKRVARPKNPVPPPPKLVIGAEEREEREGLERRSLEAIEHLSQPLRMKSLGERLERDISLARQNYLEVMRIANMEAYVGHRTFTFNLGTPENQKPPHTHAVRHISPPFKDDDYESRRGFNVMFGTVNHVRKRTPQTKRRFVKWGNGKAVLRLGSCNLNFDEEGNFSVTKQA